jgi:hypothetical protein
MVPVSLHAEQTDQRVRWQWSGFQPEPTRYDQARADQGSRRPRCQPRAAEDNLEMINEQR